MSSGDPTSVTLLLEAIGRGQRAAEEELLDLVYRELRAMARNQLRGDGLANRMQPTSLVHEAYIRLLGDDEGKWANRRHFFGAAARAMRRIRVEKARELRSKKRGGGHQPVHLRPDLAAARAGRQDQDDPVEILALHRALDGLEQIDPLAGEIVHLRHFAEMKVRQVAHALGISERQVEKKSAFAWAWLRREIERYGSSSPDRNRE